MMYSIEELGSTTDMYPEAPEDGIYIFPEDAEIGASAIEALDRNDVVFEYEVTSNRVDCYSVLGSQEKQPLHSTKSLFLQS